MSKHIPFKIININDIPDLNLKIDYSKTTCPIELKQFLDCLNKDFPNYSICKNLYQKYIKCIECSGLSCVDYK